MGPAREISPPEILVEAHPDLHLASCTCGFTPRLGAPIWRERLEASPIAGLWRDPQALARSTLAPRDEALRADVRDLLRHGGYRPTGRGKPSAEYLVRAVEEGRLGSINAAVDAGNAASYASGLPISVVDLDRLGAEEVPLCVGLAPPGSSYAFNPAGQTIDVSGLLCLLDAKGPCANAVKDAQRSKTDGDTVRTLVLIWGCTSQAARVAATLGWCRGRLEELGGALGEVTLRHAP